MSFTDGPAPNASDSFVTEIKKNCPNVFLIIFRNKNKNVVIYEAKTQDNKFNKENPVEVYWLDIDPEYRKPRREKNINHDRVELTMIESSMAYGISHELLNDKELQITFNANSELPMRVKLSDKGASLFAIRNKIPYMIRSAYVASRETINLLKPTDNITELTFNVVNLQSKSSESIRIK